MQAHAAAADIPVFNMGWGNSFLKEVIVEFVLVYVIKTESSA